MVQVEPRFTNATAIAGGETSAFFAVLCGALIDDAVAVGSQGIWRILLQSRMHPAVLKHQRTSPGGCTIGGLMVLEEGAVRGEK